MSERVRCQELELHGLLPPHRIPQDQMGHSSIQVTFDTYGHLFPQSKQESVNKLDATLSAALSSKSLGSEKGSSAGPNRPAKNELLESLLEKGGSGAPNRVSKQQLN